jgi:hypothetical protein
VIRVTEENARWDRALAPPAGFFKILGVVRDRFLISQQTHSGRRARRSLGARWDFRIAEALAERLFGQVGEREAFLNEMLCRAHRFVSDPLRWRQISAVAARLDQGRELNGRQVGEIMEEIAALCESGESDVWKQRRS